MDLPISNVDDTHTHTHTVCYLGSLVGSLYVWFWENTEQELEKISDKLETESA